MSFSKKILSIGITSALFSMASFAAGVSEQPSFPQDSQLETLKKTELSFNQLAIKVGFHEAIMRLGQPSTRGLAALWESAEARGYETHLAAEEAELLTNYGEAIDHISMQSQVTFGELQQVALQYGIDVQSKKNLRTLEGEELSAVAFSEQEEGQPDIYIHHSELKNKETTRALILAEIGELASQRVFHQTDGEFGFTLLATLYGHYDSMQSRHKALLEDDDDVLVDDRQGQSSPRRVTNVLRQMEAIFEDLENAISDVNNFAFITDSTASSLDNFVAFQSANNETLLRISALLAEVSNRYVRFEKLFNQLRDGDTNLPDFRHVGSGNYRGVRNIHFYRVIRRLDSVEARLANMSNNLSRSMIRMAVNAVEQFGREHTILHEQERAERFQSQMFAVGMVGNAFSFIASAGTSAGSLLNSVQSAVTAASNSRSRAFFDWFSRIGSAMTTASRSAEGVMRSIGWLSSSADDGFNNLSIAQIRALQSDFLSGTNGRLSRMYRGFPGARASGGDNIQTNLAVLTESIRRASYTVMQLFVFNVPGMDDRYIFDYYRDAPESPQEAILDLVWSPLVQLMEDLGIRLRHRIDFGSNILIDRNGNTMPSNSNTRIAPYHRYWYTFRWDARTVDHGRNDRHHTCTGFWGPGLVEFTRDNEIGAGNRRKARVDDFLHSPDRLMNVIQRQNGIEWDNDQESRCTAVAGQSTQAATEYYSRGNR